MIKKKIGVLISGNGSNLQALIDASRAKDYPAEIAIIISNKPDAYGLNRAAEAAIPSHVVNHKNFSSREAFDEEVHHMLTRHHVDMVCTHSTKFLRPSRCPPWSRP